MDRRWLSLEVRSVRPRITGWPRASPPIRLRGIVGDRMQTFYSQVVAPPQFFKLLHDLTNLLFIVLIGHQRGIGCANHDAILQAKRNDEVLVVSADDGAARRYADVPTDDSVA